MIVAKFNKYSNGKNATIEVALKRHVTVTGNEDHFALAYHDAQMILCGLRQADQNSRWSIVSIDMGY